MVYWLVFSVVNVCLLLGVLLESPNSLAVWCVLELLTLVGVVLFFGPNSLKISFSSLFYYLVVAGLSSFFLVAGVIMNPPLNLFLLVSVLLKLGVFPFTGWVYRVVGGSSWLVVWFFSGVLKISFVLLFFGMGVSTELAILVEVLAIASFLVASVNFWSMSRDWLYVWAHMLISSSVGLLVISYNGDLYSAFLVYTSYLVWITCTLPFLSMNPLFSLSFGEECNIYYFFLLVSVPGSLAVIYKFIVAFSLASLSWLVLIFWGLYSVVEQGYLLNFFLCYNNTQKGFGFLGLV